jgi:hypothetical protein
MLDALLLLAFACLGFAALAIAVEGCLGLSDWATELDARADPSPLGERRAPDHVPTEDVASPRGLEPLFSP